MKGILATAAIGLLAAAGPAVGQEPAPVPTSSYATVDSVQVRVVTPPRSFTGWAKTGVRSANRVVVSVTATCRVVPEEQSTNYQDSEDYTVGVEMANVDDSDDLTFCDLEYDPQPVGTTFVETQESSWSMWVNKFVGQSVGFPLSVTFKDDWADIGVNVTRVKRVFKMTLKRTRHEGSYVVRAYADKNYDKYWNYCVLQNARLYSSQGRLYCNVRYTYHYYTTEKVRTLVKTKVAWRVSGLDAFDYYVMAPSY